MANGLTRFDKEGNAALYLEFAGKKFEVHISNPDKKEYGEYQIVQTFRLRPLLWRSIHCKV